MHIERKVVVGQVGKSGVDDARTNIRLRDGRPPTTRRALKIRVLADLYRGIDFAYQVTLRWAGVGRIRNVADALNRTRLWLADYITECGNANQRDESQDPEESLRPI